MYLEHLNMVVSDMEQSLKFYRAAFPEWKVRGGGSDEWYGKPRNWLHFGDDKQYLALSDHGEGNIRDHQGTQPGLSHFAFVVSNIDSVRKRLNEAGFEVTNPGNPTEHRSNLYFRDPDGFEIEFVQYHSDLMAQRNDYS